MASKPPVVNVILRLINTKFSTLLKDLAVVIKQVWDKLIKHRTYQYYWCALLLHNHPTFAPSQVADQAKACV